MFHRQIDERRDCRGGPASSPFLLLRCLGRTGSFGFLCNEPENEGNHPSVLLSQRPPSGSSPARVKFRCWPLGDYLSRAAKRPGGVVDIAKVPTSGSRSEQTCMRRLADSTNPDFGEGASLVWVGHGPADKSPLKLMRRFTCGLQRICGPQYFA